MKTIVRHFKSGNLYSVDFDNEGKAIGTFIEAGPGNTTGDPHIGVSRYINLKNYEKIITMPTYRSQKFKDKPFNTKCNCAYCRALIK